MNWVLVPTGNPGFRVKPGMTDFIRTPSRKPLIKAVGKLLLPLIKE